MYGCRRPRGDRDLFAFRCLSNIELRAEARARMREDSNKLRVLRRQLTDDVHGDGVDTDDAHNVNHEKIDVSTI